MSIIPITVYGDKILKQKTKKVNAVNDEIIDKIRNMFDSMRNAHGIGLAANQVGYRDSIFILDLNGTEGYDNFKPLVMINPEIILHSDEKIILDEGCLSLPTIRADVERSQAIKVRYLDSDENIIEIDVDDLLARVILHEYDHLIGKMIPDRVAEDVKKNLQKDLSNIIKREVKIDYPITEG